jgi:cytosine/uracil/thiamine/allantoin permease
MLPELRAAGLIVASRILASRGMARLASPRMHANAGTLRTDLPPDVVQSPLYNDDLAPVPRERRNWSTYNFAALWISMAHCIPTYMMAGGLIALGMNWWQAPSRLRSAT